VSSAGVYIIFDCKMIVNVPVTGTVIDEYGQADPGLYIRSLNGAVKMPPFDIETHLFLNYYFSK
jgi:hypothetical protein